MSRSRQPARGRQRLAATQVAEIGALLRQEREKRGLSVQEVGRAIRFSERHVVALEEGRTDDLPPRPYARGIVVAYAGLLGFDAGDVAEVRRQSPVPHPPEAARRRGRGRRARGFNWRDWALAIACGSAVVVYAVARIALAPPAPRMPTPPPAAPPRAVALTETAPPPEAEQAPPTAPPLAAPGVRVVLRSEGTTWAEFSSDDGERRRLDLLPGRSLEILAQNRITLALGDAGVVRVKVNERELGFIGHKGETKTGMSFTPPPATKTAPAPGD